MEIVYKVFLALHITGGSTGLLAGTINIFRRKGDYTHRLADRFFLYGMLVAGASALALSCIHPNYFLFIVGVFTIYMVGTGRRALMFKKAGSYQKPKPVDMTLTIGMLLFCIAFIVLGVFKLIKGYSFGMVFLIFGLLALMMVKADFTNYNTKTELKSPWLSVHLQRMVGAYIASLTAFLVVNLPQGAWDPKFNFIPWLLPTVILVPFIFKWTRENSVKKQVKASVENQ